MAGILNNKERVMDYIITQEGKVQAGQGELKVRFASFTDYHTFYETSGSLEIPELAADATNRIFFEAYSRQQDVVVPEIEAGESMQPFKAGDFLAVGGMLASGTFKKGFSYYPNVQLLQMSSTVNGVETTSFAGLDTEIVPTFLGAVTQNFSNQRIIGSIDEFSLTNNFTLSKPDLTFAVDGKTKYARTSESEVNSEFVPSIFNDLRFRNFPNFKYLPPRNLTLPGEVTGSNLGDYLDLNEVSSTGNSSWNWQGVESFLSKKQKIPIEFSETSVTNNYVCQVFESGPAKFDKLSIIDLGTFEDQNPNSLESLESPGKRVFFVGKIVKDKFGAQTFFNIFTIVAD